MTYTKSFNYESIQDTDTIRDFIQSLIKGLDNRKVLLSSNGKVIELHPSDMLKFTVKAKRKGQTGKISLKISWREASTRLPEDADDLILLHK